MSTRFFELGLRTQVLIGIITNIIFIFTLNNNYVVSPMFEQIQILQQQNNQLLQIRDRLLPRLMSGKLEVKENN